MNHRAGSILSTFLLLVALAMGSTLIVAAQTRIDRKPNASKVSTAKPRSLYVRTPTIRIHLLEWNPAGSSTVVLLHGLNDSADVWKIVAPMLAAEHRVIAIDRRGSGSSDKPLNGYDILTLANDVIAVFERLGLDRVHLVGHSAGAGVALTVASMSAARLESVALIDGGFWPKRDDSFSSLESPDCKPKDSDCIRSHLIVQENSRYDPAPLYAGLSLPILFVVAYPSEPVANEAKRNIDEAHSFVRSVAREKVGNGEFVVVKDSGHWIHRDQPKALAEQLNEFFIKSKAGSLTSCLGQTPSNNREAERWFKNRAPWIATYKELEYFDKLSSFEDRKQFIRNFWLRRDPDPDTDENEFLTDYCERLVFSTRFDSGLPGFKTDRGMIYILWGPPDNKTEGRSEFEGLSDVRFETWQYDYIETLGKNISISFIDPTESNEYRMRLQDRSKFEGVFDCYNQGLLPTQWPQAKSSCLK